MNWFYEQIKKYVLENFKKEKPESDEQHFLRIIADANAVSQLLDHRGWQAAMSRYTETLLFRLSLLREELRKDTDNSQALKMQMAALLGEADAFGAFRQILLDGQAAEKKLKELREKQFEERQNFSAEELAQI